MQEGHHADETQAKSQDHKLALDKKVEYGVVRFSKLELSARRGAKDGRRRAKRRGSSLRGTYRTDLDSLERLLHDLFLFRGS